MGKIREPYYIRGFKWVLTENGAFDCVDTKTFIIEAISQRDAYLRMAKEHPDYVVGSMIYRHSPFHTVVRDKDILIDLDANEYAKQLGTKDLSKIIAHAVETFGNSPDFYN